jgi:glutaredoxin-like protein
MKIKIYGADWCADCRRSKQFLDGVGAEYDWIDIGRDVEAAAFVRAVNNGKQIIPLIIFPDGSFVAEPGNDVLRRKLDGLD